MTDIVKLLRALATGSIHQANKHDIIFTAAADEIEKLRVGWLDQAARDAAEIVRLEVELGKIERDLEKTLAALDHHMKGTTE